MISLSPPQASPFTLFSAAFSELCVEWMRNEWGPQCLELAAISLPINLFNSPGEGSDWWTLHTHSLPANKATHMPSQQGPALIWGPCIYRASYWNLKLTGWKDNHQWIESLSKSSGMHIQGVTHAPKSEPLFHNSQPHQSADKKHS